MARSTSRRRDQQRILAVKLADLGDVLLCEPAFRSLRAAYPDATIDVLVPPSSCALVELLDLDLNAITFAKYAFDDPRGFLNPLNTLDALRFALRLRRSRYDVVVLFHHLTTLNGARKFRALIAATGAPTVVGLDNGRGTFLSHRAADLGYGAAHESTYMLQVALEAGGSSVSSAPRFPESSIAFHHHLPEPYAVLYPATGPYSSAREWPAERYGQVARNLTASGLSVVVVGASDARMAAQTIRKTCSGVFDLTQQTTIAELAGVVRRARLVVGGDSFVGHLAAALNRPAVSIFGPTNVGAWKPVGSQLMTEPDISSGVIVRKDLPCEPCLYTGFSVGRPLGCPARTCIDLVSVGDVMAAIEVVNGASR